jgi:hypothetical protein
LREEGPWSVYHLDPMQQMNHDSAMKYFLPFLCLIFGIEIKAQNMVPNGGFEQVSALPDDDCDWELAIGWDNASSTNNCNSSNGTPDFYHLQGSGSFSSLPSNYFSSLQPFEGNAIMGLVGYSNFINNFREYIAIPLDAPLEVGTLYEVSFSLSQGTPQVSGFAIDSWGVALSESPLQQSNSNTINASTASLFEVPSVVSSSNWQTFSFPFTATAAHEFLTFGNFTNDTGITVQNNGSPGTFSFAYVFVDQIVVRRANMLLPVEFKDFNAEVMSNGNVALQWTTASEQNNSHFIIQRSENLMAWEELGRVEGAGTSNQTLEYTYTDRTAGSGTYYYQIKQVDVNADFSFSPQRAVKVTSPTMLQLDISPNPVVDHFKIKASGWNGGRKVVITDLSGNEIRTIGLSREEDNHELLLDLSSLQEGIYLVRYGSMVKRFVKI